jgi:hypothetical protein
MLAIKCRKESCKIANKMSIKVVGSHGAVGSQIGGEKQLERLKRATAVGQREWLLL